MKKLYKTIRCHGKDNAVIALSVEEYNHFPFNSKLECVGFEKKKEKVSIRKTKKFEVE